MPTFSISKETRDLIIDLAFAATVAWLWHAGKVSDTVAVGLLAPIVGARLQSRVPAGAQPPPTPPPGAVVGLFILAAAVLSRARGAAVATVVAIALLVAGCSRPCSPEALAALEARYVADMTAACRGYTRTTCPRGAEIEARYASEREGWVGCRR